MSRRGGSRHARPWPTDSSRPRPIPTWPSPERPRPPPSRRNSTPPRRSPPWGRHRPTPPRRSPFRSKPGRTRAGAATADAGLAAGQARQQVDPASFLRYRIVRRTPRGGSARSSSPSTAELNREVALKEIQERHVDHAESQFRFLFEAEVTGGLEHPGIVPVYGLGRYPDGRPYYAMRFIRGDSLKDAIKRFHAGRGPARPRLRHSLEFRQLLGRFVAVCQAIDYAHSRGVLHRDIKPDNIMLGPYGETLVVDWGLAKAARPARPAPTTPGPRPLRPLSGSDASGTLAGSVIGTPLVHEPRAGRRRGRHARARPPTSSAWARPSTTS